MDDQSKSGQITNIQTSAFVENSLPPVSSLTGTVVYKKASFLERLGASIVDGLIIIIILLILYIAFKTSESELNILASLISFIFSVLFIWKKGATPGKMLLKIKVVDYSYKSVNLWHVILRESLGKGISGILFNLGYFLVLIDKQKQAWHDKIAQTFVVKVDSVNNLISVNNEDPVTKRSKVIFGLLYLMFGLPFIAIAIFLITYIFFFRPVQISGESMNPNFITGQYYITRVQNNNFARDDVIVFHSPKDPSKDLIKRVIGLSGDKVELRSGKVYLNSKTFDESNYLKNDVITNAGSFLKENIPTIVPSGMYFVMGDNRPFSADSREWGFLPNENIISRVEFCYYNCAFPK